MIAWSFQFFCTNFELYIPLKLILWIDILNIDRIESVLSLCKNNKNSFSSSWQINEVKKRQTVCVPGGRGLQLHAQPSSKPRHCVQWWERTARNHLNCVHHPGTQSPFCLVLWKSFFQGWEEIPVLLSFLTKRNLGWVLFHSCCVLVDQVRSDGNVNSQKLNIFYLLHFLPMSVSHPSGSHEICNNCLDVAGVQNKVVLWSALCQLLDIFPKVGLVIV